MGKGSLVDYFCTPGPALSLYQLEVCHALLLPAAGGQADVLGEAAFKVQLAVILAGGVNVFLNMLVSSSLYNIDPV